MKRYFETIRLSWTLKILFKNTVSIIIEIAYGTEVFENTNNIEVAYQVIYQKIIKKENYLELSEKKTIIQLLSYIEKTLHIKLLNNKKDKNKNISLNIILLRLPTKITNVKLKIDQSDLDIWLVMQ